MKIAGLTRKGYMSYGAKNTLKRVGMVGGWLAFAKAPAGEAVGSFAKPPAGEAVGGKRGRGAVFDSNYAYFLT